jgi:hypothetical protein
MPIGAFLFLTAVFFTAAELPAASGGGRPREEK